MGQYRLEKKEKDSIIDIVRKSESLNDALASVPMRYAGIMLNVFKEVKPAMKERPVPIEIEKPWQHKMKGIFMDENWNLREVMWIYEPMGGAGKTQLATHMETTYPEDWVSIQDAGNVRDLGPVIQSEIDKGWSGYGIIVDLPRAANTSEIRIYQMLETLLSGKITVTKYKGANLLLGQRPRVVVLANFLPKIGPNTLSNDRWNIWSIQFKGCQKYATGRKAGLDDLSTAKYSAVPVAVKDTKDLKWQAEELLNTLSFDLIEELRVLLQNRSGGTLSSLN